MIAVSDLPIIKKTSDSKNNISSHILENKKFTKISHNAAIIITLISTAIKILR
jgi:hypothetical protein